MIKIRILDDLFQYQLFGKEIIQNNLKREKSQHELL